MSECRVIWWPPLVGFTCVANPVASGSRKVMFPTFRILSRNCTRTTLWWWSIGGRERERESDEFIICEQPCMKWNKGRLSTSIMFYSHLHMLKWPFRCISVHLYIAHLSVVFLWPDLPCKAISCDLKLSQTDGRQIPNPILYTHCTWFMMYTHTQWINWLTFGLCLSSYCRWDLKNTGWGHFWQGGLLWR